MSIHIRLWESVPLASVSRADSRYLRAALCKTCGARVMRGEDDDQGALWVTVDPTPLSVPGEALAILTGRDTFELTGHSGGLVLYYRDHRMIAFRRAGEKADVLPAHMCGAPELPRAPLRRRLPEPASSTPTEPPF